MPKQSRRKAAKAKIKAVKEEADAKAEAEAAAAEAERQRLEEERLQEERKRKQVIPLEKCAALNHRVPCGETKIEMMEVRSLTIRADDTWRFVKAGNDFRDATIDDMIVEMKDCLYSGEIEQGSFDQEIFDMVTETALLVWALSRPSEEDMPDGLRNIRNTIVSSATKGNATDRLGLRPIAFLLKAAETSHLHKLIDNYSSGGESSWAMCAADAWALYDAIISSHPIIVAA